jgi:hypothetical protein
VRDFDEVKKLATLPTRTVLLCLAGELVEEIAQLERQLAEVKPATSLGDASPRRAIAEQIVAVQEQMRESTVEFRLRALPSRSWSKFWASMPVRAEKEADEDWGERLFPFYAELVHRACADPVMSVEQVGELADVLHANAWNRLVSNCLSLNMGEVDVPNSEAVSELTGNSEQT